MKNNAAIGVLAYGSLINDPGLELQQLIINRINCETPFEVEFARISESRNNAPTLIPVKNGEGSRVNAQILVLKDNITLEEAQNILWRRETRTKNKSKTYRSPVNKNKNTVSINILENFHGIDKVLYTSIPSNMGILNSPDILAHFAIQSILSEAGAKELDGIRYLLNAQKNGIQTTKSLSYQNFILSETNSKTLEEAISKLDTQRPRNLSAKSDLENFEKDILKICNYAFQYGIDNTIPKLPSNPEEMLEMIQTRKEKFLINCHTGFKEAQNLALKLVLQFQDEIINSKEKLKSLRSSGQKRSAKELELDIRRIESKEKIVRHIIDGIVWQIINGQTYISRRLYQGVKGDKILKHSNLSSVLALVESINKNEKHFALITDLTGYVQVGDLLVVKDNTIQIIEVKEGAKNHQILEIALSIIEGERKPVEVLSEAKLDKKSGEQLIRQLKQHVNMMNLGSILNLDKGIDVKSGKPISIITPDEPTYRYDERLRGIIKQLETRELLGYDVIDECLHIGVFKGNFNFIGETLLKTMAGSSEMKSIIMNLRNVVNSLHRPIFSMPFPKEMIFDILFGRINVFMLLDLEKYIELYRKLGYEAVLATRKETMRAMETYKSTDIYKFENRGIRISLGNERDMWLSSGVFTKIFFDLVCPIYTAYSTKYFITNPQDDDSNEEDQ